MKILVITILLTIAFHLNAIAKETANRYLPDEYAGYMVYETTNKRGDRILVKSPVKYKIRASEENEDNDENYQYRNYRIELQRSQEEQEAKEQQEDEEKKINSAAYYPLYFD